MKTTEPPPTVSVTKSDQEPVPSFGEALTQLEALVAQLEGDADLDLDSALRLYEHGAALAAACRERLRAAELHLTEITTAAAALPGA